APRGNSAQTLAADSGRRTKVMKRKLFALALLLASVISRAEQLRVPAFTAYTEPNANGARVSQNSGITGWRDPNLKILWFGEINTPGTLDAALALRLPSNTVSKLRLAVAGQSHDANVKGAGTNLITAKFGSFTIKEIGYQ